MEHGTCIFKDGTSACDVKKETIISGVKKMKLQTLGAKRLAVFYVNSVIVRGIFFRSSILGPGSVAALISL